MNSSKTPAVLTNHKRGGTEILMERAISNDLMTICLLHKKNSSLT